jgi:hypothetical protein
LPREGIKVDTKKSHAMRGWPTPQTVKDVKIIPGGMEHCLPRCIGQLQESLSDGTNNIPTMKTGTKKLGSKPPKAWAPNINPRYSISI